MDRVFKRNQGRNTTEQQNSSEVCKGEGVPKITPCVTSATVSFSKCTTCCCKEGLVKTGASHALISGSESECGLFFVFMDTLIRILLSGWRFAGIVGNFAEKCFT